MITHHPNDLTVMEFAAGTLDEGRSLVAAEHLARCEQCRRFVSNLEHMGGHLLERIALEALAADARDKALARIDRLEGASKSASRPANFKPLSHYPAGQWRWIAPGLHLRKIEMPAGTQTRVFMLKAAPGIKLPHHSHTGTEMTCVLSGAFIHEGGRFAAGDCDDADQDVEHSPVVDVGEECICVVAMQGTIKLRGMFGRLLQPLIRL
ncbi:MAG: ChrR family anti-sigma-E factor [Pseudolabrys sp.]